MRRHIESKTKKRMSAEDRKKAILETTVSFISQFGFWGFTIRDVAQAQNITEAGLLYYFKSKEQLLEETPQIRRPHQPNRHCRASWR